MTSAKDQTSAKDHFMLLVGPPLDCLTCACGHTEQIEGDLNRAFERMHEHLHAVVCAWCGSRYRPISDNETQGDTCASSIYQVTDQVLTRVKDPNVSPNGPPDLRLGEWLVQGHYGSTSYDCELYRFVQDPPTAAADPVCDNCILARDTAGDLEQIKGQFPW
jgi:hypothetical protein